MEDIKRKDLQVAFTAALDKDKNIMLKTAIPMIYRYLNSELVNKSVKTINEQSKYKEATSDCGFEGCDNYQWDHICRCQ